MASTGRDKTQMIKYRIPDEDYLALSITNPKIAEAIDNWSGGFWVSVSNVPEHTREEFVQIGDRFYAFAKLEKNMGKEFYAVWSYSFSIAWFSVDTFPKFHNKDIEVFYFNGRMTVNDPDNLT